jgi:hypothetical protein
MLQVACTLKDSQLKFRISPTRSICLYHIAYTNSSVSIMSDYRLNDRATGVRSTVEAKDFSSSLCFQTNSQAHLASYPKGNGGPFPGVKRCRGVTLTTHPRLVPKSRINRSYTSSPLCRLHSGRGTTLLFKRKRDDVASRRRETANQLRNANLWYASTKKINK